MGAMTVWSQRSETMREALTWWSPAGPLVGESGVGVFIWVLAWTLLHFGLRHRNPNAGRAIKWVWILISLAFLTTFPPFLHLFDP